MTQNALSDPWTEPSPDYRVEDYPDLDRKCLFCTTTGVEIVRVKGADTDKFLQGQATCDIAAVNIDQAGRGAICTPQGRMISNFDIYRTGPDEIRLLLPQGMAEPTLTHLKKYAVFYKTELSLETGQRIAAVFGKGADQQIAQLAGDANEHSAREIHRGRAIRIAADNWILAIDPDAAIDLWRSISEHVIPVGDNLWRLNKIRAGLADVVPQTSEEFIPQMLNLQHIGAISFRKGCYTGQEIVARMQYLGKLKRRMYRLSINATAPPEPGTELLDSPGGRPVGNVVIAATAGETRIELLAVLTNEAATGGTVAIGETSLPFEVLAMPYDDDFDRAE